MFKWRILVEEGRKNGHTFSQPDLIIAATALEHGLTVVSRDTARLRDGAGAGAQSVEGVAGKKNVDRLTSAGFVQMWRDRIDTLTPATPTPVHSSRAHLAASPIKYLCRWI